MIDPRSQDSTAWLPVSYSSAGHRTTPHAMHLQVAAALPSSETIPHAVLFHYCILLVFTSFPGQHSL